MRVILVFEYEYAAFGSDGPDGVRYGLLWWEIFYDRNGVMGIDGIEQ